MAETSATLTRHDGTIVARSGDVIRDLDIYVNSGAGIDVDGVQNVTISNVRIHYNGAGNKNSDIGSKIINMGIIAVNADGLKIDQVEIINAGAPASGAERSPEHYGIALYGSPGAQISNVIVRDTSTGIYVQDSPNTALQGIEGYDMRGPFPRGQLVQFNRSSNSSLTNFYVKNDLNKSWTEDNIHVGGSDGVTITNGVINGNNSPSGVGVMLEGATNTTVRNVDVVHMGNGGFTDIGSGNVFDYVRSFDNHATGYAGRKPPLSNALIFGLANDTIITHAAYQNPANPENIVYGGGIQDDAFGGTFDAHEITGQTPMSGWLNTFSWPPLVEGTPGADTLQGTLGADNLRGGLGDDTYVVNNVGDKVIEVAGEGTDTVRASVSFSSAGQDLEKLTLTGSGAINGTGNDLANLIIGNGAANVLDGGAGADTLQGGLGNDTFAFSAALVTGSYDHIKDFSPSASGNNDTIQLAQSAFGSLATGPLAAAAFKDLGVKGATVDASDRILYNSRTGVLSYDADGSGTAFTAVPFATLDNKPVITAGDFTVV